MRRAAVGLRSPEMRSGAWRRWHAFAALAAREAAGHQRLVAHQQEFRIRVAFGGQF